VGDCWNLYELGPITNCKIPNKSQRPIHVSKEDVETLQYHLACKVEVVILKYRSPLYFLKSSMRRRKRSPHARARLASPGGAKGADARHLREWSAEIRLLALRERGLLLQF
jgi:hypothetical protein